MRKPKATVQSLRKELKALQAKFDKFRTDVRAYILAASSISNRRILMSIQPANDKGMINGMTIPELVMLVNLQKGTGEHIILDSEKQGRNLLVISKKNLPPTPWELL
jgi:hypothetical protein